MTDQEIEKLRGKLGSDYSVKRQNGAITVELADIWEGVEFAECLEDALGYEAGKIYPVTGFSNEYQTDFVDTLFDEFGSPKNGMYKAHAKPSTESAYVEQLKSKAKELYGEIKDGDLFDRKELFPKVFLNPDSIAHSFKGWSYQKDCDQLYFGNLGIYKQGKWAKNVEEPIEVYPAAVGKMRFKKGLVFEIPMNEKAMMESEEKGIFQCGKHLSKCLQEYLNK